ncbi:MAG: T9SS type A sorting domain-containing protein [Chitinophagaceae bacterium]|nr:T9SS type A sorting domain-containing protein [Chitinophagaceae bacterium]
MIKLLLRNQGFAFILLFLLFTQSAHAFLVSELQATYRYGQVFLTWKNSTTTNLQYNVYRSTSPLNATNLNATTFLGYVRDNSAKNVRKASLYTGSFYFKITDSGSPLASDRGLYVATCTNNASYYYAVTIVNLSTGVEDKSLINSANSLAVPVAETIADPQAVLQLQNNETDGSVRYEYAMWGNNQNASHFPAFNNAGSYAHNFTVFKVGNSTNRSIYIQYKDDNPFSNSGINVCTDCNVIKIDDRLPNGVDSYWSGWNENYNMYSTTNPVATSGVVKMYTQARLKETIEWLRKNISADSNRVYLIGVSHNAFGALLTSQMWPNQVTAVSAKNAPIIIKPINNSPREEQWCDNLVNLNSDYNDPNTGLPILIWDLFSIYHMYGINKTRGIPFNEGINGKKDVTVGWVQKFYWYDSVNVYNQGGAWYWDQRTHNNTGGLFLDEEVSPAFERFSLARSYPAFAYCSINQNPGNGTPTDGAPVGAINGYLDWNDASINDISTNYDITCFVKNFYAGGVLLANQYDSCTTNITFRRLQQFKPLVGQVITWAVRKNNGNVIQQGTMVYNGGPITLTGIKIYKVGSNISLSVPGCTTKYYADTDHDGYGSSTDAGTIYCIAPNGFVTNNNDCNDNNVSINPLAQEVCDANDIDEDCDGMSDDADASVTGKMVYYPDADHDGFGSSTSSGTLYCNPPAWYITNKTDCNDANSAVRPNGQEICDANDVDEDCDGLSDDADASVTGKQTYYIDADHDGFGSIILPGTAYCNPPAWTVTNHTDCNDLNAAIFPTAVEICDLFSIDENCNGLSDDADPAATGKISYYPDADLDGYGTSAGSGTAYCHPPLGLQSSHNDCNDNNITINPAAIEICDVNNIDENCNGLADNADALALGKIIYYKDVDLDGFGSLADAGTFYCDQPAATTLNHTDCNDANASINPSAGEICDANDADEDCDGLADDLDLSVTGKQIYYIDADHDGFGNSLLPGTPFCNAPEWTVTNNTDCNDINAAINPMANELCNASLIDEDCDGLIDAADPSAIGTIIYYVDADLDGFGSASAIGTAYCNPPAGLVTSHNDCNDNNASINPNATEICDLNNVDENCNGLADNADANAIGKIIYYKDVDLDAFGDLSDAGTLYCDQPAATTLNHTDCNDANASINPAASEVCDPNHLDEDCDGLADSADPSATGATSYYIDSDNDGYGSAIATGTVYCTPPAGYVSNQTDCNDANSAVNPGTQEICSANNIDENCNGLADNADPGAIGKLTYYADADNDGYGSATASGIAYCQPPAGVSLTHNDCADGNANINPGAPDICDGIDNNCNGTVDENAISVTVTAAGSLSGCKTDFITLTATGNNITSYKWYKGSNPNSVAGQSNSTYNLNYETTTVKAVVSNGFGCTVTSNIISLTALNSPASTITVLNNGNLNLCAGPVTLTATGGTNYTWQWYMNDVAIAGATGINYTATGNGVITVKVTNVTGCYKISNPVTVFGQANFYVDADLDGYGSSTATASTFCTPPPGTSINNTDCNDANSSVNPGVQEICSANNIDENCNGLADNADPGAIGKLTYYADADNDGYGSATASGIAYCQPPAGVSLTHNDCADGNANINPGAPDICDGIDNNCNGTVDENAISVTVTAAGSLSGCKTDFITLTATGNNITSYKWYKGSNPNSVAGQSNSTYNLNYETTTVKAVVSNGFGCTVTSNIISLTALNSPASTITVLNNGNLNLCAGAVTLAATGGTNYTWQWYMNDVAIAGATGINYTATGNGVITVKVTNVTGCYKISNPVTVFGQANFYVDADLDGYGSSTATASSFCIPPAGMVNNNTDCNDANSAVNPGAQEICSANNIDENCNGLADNADPAAIGLLTYYIDADNDGYGSAVAPGTSYCFPPAGLVSNHSDCNDANSAIKPNAQEICDANAIDENCNGLADNADPSAIGKVTYYPDADNDSYGSASSSGTAYCIPPAGVTLSHNDCADGNAAINPAAIDICDGLDNNCDGVVDENAPTIIITAGGPLTGCKCDSITLTASGNNITSYKWYKGSNPNSIAGQSNATYTLKYETTTVTAVASNGFGCSTTSNGISLISLNLPAAVITAINNGNLNICEGTVTLGASGGANYTWQWYRNDVIISGATDSNFIATINGTYTVKVTNVSGCFKLSDPVTVFGQSNFYLDEDLDGYGSRTSEPSLACTTPAGMAPNNTDCNDSINSIHPGAQEVCSTNFIDEDCNGLADNFDPATMGRLYYYIDSDNDGYGSALATGTLSCFAPEGLVSNNTDCNDENSLVKPDALEICDANAIDENCNGLADNADPSAIGKVTYYPDADNDSYGSASSSGTAYCIPPAGVALSHNDCADGNAAINPAAIDICDGLDNNCDGVVDENAPTIIITAGGPLTGCKCDSITLTASGNNITSYKWYKGSNPNSIAGQSNATYTLKYETTTVTAVASNGFGCSTTSNGISLISLNLPAAVITALNNGNLNICEGTVTLGASGGANYTWQWYRNDVIISGATDSNFIATINGTYTVKVTNVSGCFKLSDPVTVFGQSNFYLDEDLDGYGSSTSTASLFCTPPAGMTINNTDCNDANSAIHPGAQEICSANNIDEDCNGLADNADPSAIGLLSYYIDADNDGYGSALATGTAYCFPPAGFVSNNTDCNDENDAINPVAQEICDANSIDENCNGLADNQDTLASGKIIYYTDADNDGYGSVAAAGTAYCHPPAGVAVSNNDCNDANGLVNPAASEICDANMVDEDCDGVADDNDVSVFGQALYYPDADHDGYGATAISGTAYCHPPAELVIDNTDCNDSNSEINPSVVELCDNTIDDNCNGFIDNADPTIAGSTLYYKDLDMDGFGDATDPGTTYCSAPAGKVLNHTDCNDANNLVNPFASEICDANHIDENCNGLSDDNDPGVLGSVLYYPDADMDGFGAANNPGTKYCSPPSGEVASNNDCNDANSSVKPTAIEICDANHIDENCNGLSDDADPLALGKIVYYADADNDGYGSLTAPGIAFCAPPAGVVTSHDDCNDGVASVNPAAAEICDENNVDENCNGLSDDLDLTATGKILYYADIDLDGFGTSSGSGSGFCDAPLNLVTNHSDCNDNNAAIKPSATEICDANDVDEDCDGLGDDADPSAIGKILYYPDADLDGYGALNATGSAWCNQPVGKVSNKTDCNDANSSINPAGTEICDANDLDEDCDGLSDDNDASVVGKMNYYPDADNDGYGSTGGSGILYCNPPLGKAPNQNDCNDNNPAIHPGATEFCDANGLDEDCDGLSDNNDPSAIGKVTYYVDADGDTYGSSSDPGTAYCFPPAGVVTSKTDCADNNASIKPGATEICDGIDNNCNGLIDENLNPSNPMPQPVITPVGSTSFCYDQSVTLNAPVGFNNYTWSNGKVGQSITANLEGNITVTVKDANNCYGTSAPVNLTVWEPAVPTLSLSGPSTYCVENPSVLSTIPGYSYQWKKGSTVLTGATNQSYSPTSTSTVYKVTINDVHGCTKTSDNFSVTVNSAAVPVISTTGGTSICIGQSTTLNATAGYNSYLWSTGQTTSSIPVSIAGNYTVVGTDQDGCSAVSLAKTIVVNPLPQPVITAQGPTSFCDGGSVTLDAGSGYSTYNWSNGKNTSSVNITGSGSYSVTVTNSNSCSGTASAVTVTEWVPEIPTIVTSIGATTFCANTGVYLTTISGTAYQWQKSGVDIAGATAKNYTPTSSGSYKVTVIDLHGCQATSVSFSITILSNPVPVITGTSTICNGFTTLLSCGTFNAYLWSTGSVAASITPGAAGDYTVTVTDANGCVGTSAPKTTTVVPLPTPVITAQGPIQFCDGGSVTLDAGSGYNSYSWSNSKFTQTNVINSSGTYTVTVTNANGCSGTSTPVTVDEWIPPTPVVSTSTGATTFCANAGVFLTTIGGYGYQWQKSSLDIAGATLQNYTPTSGGSYKVIITDIHGCSKTATALTITINNNPVPVIAGSGIVCQGSSVTLTCGTFVTYSWSTGSTASSIISTTSNSYTVTVTDVNGCPGTSAPKTTTLTALPTPVITAQGPIQFCDGGSVTLDAGSGYSSYNWSNSKTTQTNPITASGTFTVTVTNASGCSGTSAPVTVDEWIPPTPSVTIVGPATFCANNSTTYLTTLAGPYSYQWIKGSTDQAGATNQNYSPTATASYKVKITDIHGCSKTSGTVSITANSAPTASINISGSANICSGQTKTINANTGTGLTYQWKKEGITISGATASSYVASVAGNYTCVVTNSNGCSSTSNIMVITSNCKDDEALVEIKSDASWLLYPNPTSNDLHVRLSLGTKESGNYEMEIRNMLGEIVWSNKSLFSEHTVSEDLFLNDRLPAGIYFVIVNANGDIYHTQFILTRK